MWRACEQANERSHFREWNYNRPNHRIHSSNRFSIGHSIFDFSVACNSVLSAQTSLLWFQLVLRCQVLRPTKAPTKRYRLRSCCSCAVLIECAGILLFKCRPCCYLPAVVVYRHSSRLFNICRDPDLEPPRPPFATATDAFPTQPASAHFTLNAYCPSSRPSEIRKNK